MRTFYYSILVIFGLLLVLAISSSYYKYLIAGDYIVKSQIACDPKIKNCFVYICDANLEECTGNPEEDTFYYQYAYRKSKNIPCEENTECDFTCQPDEVDCWQEQCTLSDDTDNSCYTEKNISSSDSELN